MAWIKQSEKRMDWDVTRNAASSTIWDGGDTIWDNGSLLWDAEFTSWSGQGASANTWTDQ